MSERQQLLGSSASPRPWIVRFLALSLLCLAHAGCGRGGAAEYSPSFGDRPRSAGAAVEYTFGIFPLHNAVHLFQVYQPMVDVINQRAVGFSVKLETARDYPSYDDKLHRRGLDLALVNPYQAIVAERDGYRVFGKMANDDRLVGIIVTRKGAGVRVPADLKEAPISFPAPTAFAATMMNKLFLKQHGLDVEREAVPKYVGSQDSAVMNVFLGLTRAGGTWPPTWEAMKKDRPDVVQALEVKWQTPPLVNLGLVAREGVPEEHVRSIASVLFNLHRSEPGREMLQRMGTSRYLPATSASYDPVRRFLLEYRREFRAEPKREAAR